MHDYCPRAEALVAAVKAQLKAAGISDRPTCAPLPWFDLQPAPLDFSLDAALQGATPTADNLAALGTQVSLLHRREAMGPDGATLLGLHELLTYGLKGVSAYAHHAEMMGAADPDLDGTLLEVSEHRWQRCCCKGIR